MPIVVQMTSNEDRIAAGSPWSRQGGAICSIAILLLGAALVVYGGALMTVGHKPLQEGKQPGIRPLSSLICNGKRR